MYKVLLFMATLGASFAVVPLSVTDTGIDRLDIATTGPTSSVIDMQGGQVQTNQLALTIAVSASTTTRVRVSCDESATNPGNASDWGAISFCDSSNPSACVPDIRQYTLSSYTKRSGVYTLSSRWDVRKRYVRCRVYDPDTGKGQVTVTGERSWQ